jgi:hypothetical protein
MRQGLPPETFEGEHCMTSRASFLITAAAAATLSATLLPAQAAMPVSATQAAANRDVTLVQAPAGVQTPTATTQTPATTPDATTDTGQKKRTASRSKKQTRQQEVDSSVQSGTVPRRYMQNVPKQYHNLIPWGQQ